MAKRTRLVWEEPPTRESVWIKRLTPVMERTGEWAKVYKTGSTAAASAVVGNLRSGKFKSPEGEWEFVAAESAVYAKFLGTGAKSKRAKRK